MVTHPEGGRVRGALLHHPAPVGGRRPDSKTQKLTDGLTFWAVPDDEVPTPKSRLMRVSETAAYLGIHRTKLWRLLNLPVPEGRGFRYPYWRSFRLSSPSLTRRDYSIRNLP